jgi:membrane-bound ClpP family serine protease
VTSITPDSRLRPTEAVAGILAAAALFVGFLELFYRPFRLAPIALILLLIATVMSRDQQRLIGLATAVVGACFVVGAALQVVTNHPLF